MAWERARVLAGQVWDRLLVTFSRCLPEDQQKVPSFLLRFSSEEGLPPAPSLGPDSQAPWPYLDPSRLLRIQEAKPRNGPNPACLALNASRPPEQSLPGAAPAHLVAMWGGGGAPLEVLWAVCWAEGCGVRCRKPSRVQINLPEA